MRATVPMNRQQRRERGQPKRTPETTPMQVMLVTRREFTREDGSIVAQSFFAPVSADGRALVEDTPDGPQAVVFPSAPIVIKRAPLIAVPNSKLTVVRQ